MCACLCMCMCEGRGSEGLGWKRGACWRVGLRGLDRLAGLRGAVGLWGSGATGLLGSVGCWLEAVGRLIGFGALMKFL